MKSVEGMHNDRHWASNNFLTYLRYLPSL